MKRYFLLRNNQESGPFLLQDLKAMGLEAKDLIWVEHNSSSWRFPDEIEELKGFVRPQTSKTKPATSRKNHSAISISLPSGPSNQLQQLAEDYASFRQEFTGCRSDPGPASQPVMACDETGAEAKPVWRRRFPASIVNAANVAAVFIGLLLGAVIVKKLVDSYPSSMEEAPVAASVVMEQPVADKNLHNALAKEMVPQAVEKPLVKPKPKELKKQLQLKGSDYKVGLFGGISGLELTVVNASPHSVDKVTVAVKYLKKNGEVIETEFFELTSLKPHSSKVLAVPSKNRGMKVEYKIVAVASEEYRAKMKQV